MNRFTLRASTDGWILEDDRFPEIIFRLAGRAGAFAAARKYLFKHQGLLTVLDSAGTVEEQWYHWREPR